MVSVVLRITKLPSRASAKRKSLPFASVEGNDIIVRSPLAKDVPLNEHLVWLWGILQHERRYLRGLQSEGALIAVHASGTRGTIEVKPNGAELLHILGATLLIARE